MKKILTIVTVPIFFGGLMAVIMLFLTTPNQDTKRGKIEFKFTDIETKKMISGVKIHVIYDRLIKLPIIGQYKYKTSKTHYSNKDGLAYIAGSNLPWSIDITKNKYQIEESDTNSETTHKFYLRKSK